MLLRNLSRTAFQGADSSVTSSRQFETALLGALAGFCSPCASSSSARVSAIVAGVPAPSVQVAFVITTSYVVIASIMLQDSTALTASVFQDAGLACTNVTLVGAPSITLDTSPPAPAPAPISRVGIAFGVVDLIGAVAVLALCLGVYSSSGRNFLSQWRRGAPPQLDRHAYAAAEGGGVGDQSAGRVLSFEMEEERPAGGLDGSARARAGTRESNEAWW